jgi:hypothetical protein
MTPDANFRIASQSKAITSTAVLMLVEEGKIAPDRSSEPLHSRVCEHHRCMTTNQIGTLYPAG